MIVPDFWDEHKERRKLPNGRQATITRFGWSEFTQKEAKELAVKRVEEAFKQLAAGEEVERREKRVSYNGSDGVPIREEVIQYHGEAVVTRNLYGSLCINTPNVLFADIDFYNVHLKQRVSAFWTYIIMILGCLHYYFTPNLIYNFSWNVLGFELQYYTAKYLNEINPGLLLFGLGLLLWLIIKSRNGGPYGSDKQRGEKSTAMAMAPIKEFSELYPDWHMRVYRTPAGLRVMVMHDVFNPNDPVVQEFFEALETDPLYVLMCTRQNCFRARVSPKPWRVLANDVEQKLNQGVWPVGKNLLAERKAWVEAYDSAANSFASCHFIEEVGSGLVNEACEKLRQVHDKYCKADELGLKIA